MTTIRIGLRRLFALGIASIVVLNAPAAFADMCSGVRSEAEYLRSAIEARIRELDEALFFQRLENNRAGEFENKCASRDDGSPQCSALYTSLAAARSLREREEDHVRAASRDLSNLRQRYPLANRKFAECAEQQAAEGNSPPDSGALIPMPNYRQVQRERDQLYKDDRVAGLPDYDPNVDLTPPNKLGDRSVRGPSRRLGPYVPPKREAPPSDVLAPVAPEPTAPERITTMPPGIPAPEDLPTDQREKLRKALTGLPPPGPGEATGQTPAEPSTNAKRITTMSPGMPAPAELPPADRQKLRNALKGLPPPGPGESNGPPDDHEPSPPSRPAEVPQSHAGSNPASPPEHANPPISPPTPPQTVPSPPTKTAALPPPPAPSGPNKAAPVQPPPVATTPNPPSGLGPNQKRECTSDPKSGAQTCTTLTRQCYVWPEKTYCGFLPLKPGEATVLSCGHVDKNGVPVTGVTGQPGCLPDNTKSIGECKVDPKTNEEKCALAIAGSGNQLPQKSATPAPPAFPPITGLQAAVPATPSAQPSTSAAARVMPAQLPGDPIGAPPKAHTPAPLPKVALLPPQPVMPHQAVPSPHVNILEPAALPAPHVNIYTPPAAHSSSPRPPVATLPPPAVVGTHTPALLPPAAVAPTHTLPAAPKSLPPVAVAPTPPPPTEPRCAWPAGKVKAKDAANVENTMVVGGNAACRTRWVPGTGTTQLAIALASPPSHGSVTTEGTALVYKPGTGFKGSDVFVITVNWTNRTGQHSGTATYNVTVK